MQASNQFQCHNDGDEDDNCCACWCRDLTATRMAEADYMILYLETTPAPKSTSWMPATKTGSSVDASSGSSGSSSNNSSSSTNTSVFFDEMSQIDANRREPLSNDASTSSHIYSAKNQAVCSFPMVVLLLLSLSLSSSSSLLLFFIVFFFFFFSFSSSSSSSFFLLLLHLLLLFLFVFFFFLLFFLLMW